MDPFGKYLRWAGTTPRRLFLLLAIGASIGAISANQVGDMSSRPAVVDNSLRAVIYKGYVTLLIDRTRLSWCDVQPSRIAFQMGQIGSVRIPMVLPLSTQGLVWPELGRQEFGLMVARVQDLAPGRWTVMITRRDRCHWYNYVTGPDVTSSMTFVDVPVVPNEEQTR